MECSKCGAELDFREAFCSKCGELTQRSRPAAEQLGKAAAELGSAARDFGTEISKSRGKAWNYIRDEANRKQVIAGGAVLLLLAVALTDNPISNLASDGFGSDPDGPQLTADGTPDFAHYEDVFLDEEARYQVTSTANVRDYPTSQGTQVTHTFRGGETVFAREVMAFDRTSRWFKLTSGGYIWGGNLDGISDLEIDQAANLPQSLVGLWSDRARCFEEEYEAKIAVYENEILIGSNEYRFTGNLISSGEGVEYEFSPGGEGGSAFIFQPNGGQYIALRYASDLTSKSCTYFPESDSCQQIHALIREVF